MRLIGMLVLGAAIGWFARDLTFDKSSQRADRSGARRTADDSDLPKRDAPAPPADGNKEDKPPAATSEGVEPGTKPDASGKPKDDPIRDMVTSMAGQWKAMSSMFAQQRNWKSLLLALGFDAETAEKIEDLIGTEAARQTARAVEMMLDGDIELDPEAFYWFMGVGPELSTEMERDLALFLSDDELGSVRSEIKAAHEKQLIGYANMTMGMMSIPDLSSDQKTQIREALAGKDFIREQLVGFAQLTRNRKALLHVLKNPKAMGKEMAEQMKPMRRRMQSILRSDQLAQYDRFEKQAIRLAEINIKMMGGVLTKSEAKTPAGK